MPTCTSLLGHLAQVPDPRCARGQRYAYAYLYAIVSAALMAGQTSVLDMAQWAQRHAAELLAHLQPAKPRIPSVSTLRRLLNGQDLAALERQVAAHNRALDDADALTGCVPTANGQVLRAQAVDGKDVRGARAHGRRVFLVSRVRHGTAYVLGQEVVDIKTNEITVVPKLLAGLDLSGTVTTMDALLTQQALARQILEQHGHYLMIVKKNQPELYHSLTLLFATPPVPARPGELLHFQSQSKAHGRLERRQLDSSTALNDFLTWPGAAQVLRRTCRRVNLSTGEVEAETTYGITSLPRLLAGPKELETIWRGHWTIENVLHYVRDVTLGEDRCQVHTASGPQGLATLRNAILTLLRHHGWSNIAQATRCYDAHPQRALRLLTGLTL